MAEHADLRHRPGMLSNEKCIEVSQRAMGAEAALHEPTADVDAMVLGLSDGGKGTFHLLSKAGSREAWPPCIVRAPGEEESRVGQAFASGARGYVTKRRASEEMLLATGGVAAKRTSPPLSKGRSV